MRLKKYLTEATGESVDKTKLISKKFNTLSNRYNRKFLTMAKNLRKKEGVLILTSVNYREKREKLEDEFLSAVKRIMDEIDYKDTKLFNSIVSKFSITIQRSDLAYRNRNFIDSLKNYILSKNPYINFNLNRC